MGGLKGLSEREIREAIRNDFWVVIKAGLRLWPLVSLVLFTLVPVKNRLLVGNLVGVGWGIYLSLVAAAG
ncbi:MAG: hypothetical protein M1829_000297 [Trizodia sp. TS-e1964]|nr:MAG: hypothetical protein M1829_000297 [Trizodia sp. TS-e1964]